MTLTRYKRLSLQNTGQFSKYIPLHWAVPCEQRVRMAFSVYQVSDVVGLFTR